VEFGKKSSHNPHIQLACCHNFLKEGGAEMLTVAEFLEWLRVFRYTGTVHYAGTPWKVDDNDVNEFIRTCENHPRFIQEALEQGNCTECREAMAYLKYLEQAAKVYSPSF
jgi:hypothetical protein